MTGRRRAHALASLALLALVAWPVAADADEPPDLEGPWVQQVVTTAVSDVPVIGEVTTRTTTAQRVEVEQTGDDLQLTTRVCDIDVDSSMSQVETKIPKPFVEALGESTRSASLVERDDGYRLVTSKNHEILGAELRAPESEHLPDEPDDPRVVDADDDGHPGVTVRVEGMIDGELYLVHRGWDAFRGELDGNDTIAGPVEWGQEQVVLDSSSVFLGDAPDSKPHPEASEHRMRMKKLDDARSCDQLSSADDYFD